MGLQKVPVREIYDKTLDELYKTLNVERFRVVAINKNQDRDGEMEITIDIAIRPRDYKNNFMLNSAEHEIFPAHKC